MIRRSIGKIVWHFRNKKSWNQNKLKLEQEYEEGKKLYKKHANSLMTISLSPSALGVKVIRPDDYNNQTEFHIPASFANIVAVISKEIKERFNYASNARFLTGDYVLMRELKERDFPKLVEDVPEIREKKIWGMYLKEAHTLPMIEEMLDLLIPIAEKSIFQSYVEIESCLIYRTQFTAFPETSSQVWHSDNHQNLVMKIMIYLNDVNKVNGPFEYLEDPDTHSNPRVEGSVPRKYLDGRIPYRVIKDYIHRGYERRLAEGKQGTVIFFDDNIIHRGNVPLEGYRDAIVLQLKPSTKQTPPYVRHGVTTWIL